jgi:hypothetical protein
MVLVIKYSKEFNFTLLLLFCGFLISCQSKGTMLAKTDRTDKVREYLNESHQTEVLDLKITKKVNESNLLDKSIPYVATYTSPELKYRMATMQFYDENGIKIDFDNYSEEITSLNADNLVEAEGGDIPFVIYNRIISARSENQDWTLSNFSLEELQKKVFEGAEFQILVLATAPDILENKEKYELFHIEIMRRLKAQHIENGRLEFIFLDGELNLEEYRTSPSTPIVASSPIRQHTLQRWVSIHKIKWYDMVKDHPDKVLKYGKVFSK